MVLSTSRDIHCMKIAFICLSHGDDSCTCLCDQYGLTAFIYNNNIVLEWCNVAVIDHLQQPFSASMEGAKQKQNQHI